LAPPFATDLSQRSNRFDSHVSVADLNERCQLGDVCFIFQAAESANGESACIGVRLLEKRQQRRSSATILDTL